MLKLTSGDFKKQLCLGATPRDSDLSGPGRGSLNDSNVQTRMSSAALSDPLDAGDLGL